VDAEESPVISPSAVPQFHGAHLKSWRAWELSCSLQASVERWIYSGGYRFERVAADGEHVVYIRFTELPGEWSLLIGECVQHMRNSLDNLVYGLSELEAGRTLTEEEGRDLTYPILTKAMSSSKIDSTLGFLPQAVREFVLESQPYASSDPENTRLWTLHRLAVLDKHRAIPTSLVSMSSARTTGTVTSMEFVTPMTPLKDGDWIATFATTRELASADPGIDAALRVVFDETIPAVARVEVVRILKDLREFVQRIHNQMLALAGYDAMQAWMLPTTVSEPASDAD
jgi:hypothetical protein